MRSSSSAPISSLNCGDNGIAPVQAAGLLSFAVFYGLDWIATGHQLGAAAAAFGAGLIREQTGNDLLAFTIAGGFGMLAALMAVTLARGARARAA